MKKIVRIKIHMKRFFQICIMIVVISFPNLANTYNEDQIENEYFMTSIEGFINSPSYEDLELIEDEDEKYCEEVYLEAARRRDFTEEENLLCGQFFETKIEEEMNYMRYMMSNRGIY